jgi:hypothetical protein
LFAVPAGRAATYDRQVAEIDLEPETLAERGDSGRRVLWTDLPARSAVLTMEVPVIRGRPDVELLAPVAAVCVTDDAEVFEDAQGSVDRRGRCPGVDFPTAFDQFAAGDVTVSPGQDVEEQPPLWRPAKAAGMEIVADRRSGRLED